MTPSLVDKSVQGVQPESKADVSSKDLSGVHLTYEGGPIKPSNLKWLNETSKDTSLEDMRQRFARDGYLLVKGLLPKEDLLSLRKAYFGFMSPTGMCNSGDEKEGVFSYNKDAAEYAVIGSANFPTLWKPDTVSTYLKLVEDAHMIPEYSRLLKHPDLLEFIKRFEDWDDTVLLRRTMFRSNVPGAPGGAIHYDHLFLRAGDPSFLTAWIPVGDISPVGGGLIYLENSVPLGKAMEDKWQTEAKSFSYEERICAWNQTMTEGARVATNAAELGEKTNKKWMVGNYEAGDVMFHDAFMIHTSCPNEDPNGIIRLSTDLRFCNPKKAIDNRWMNDWKIGDGI